MAGTNSPDIKNCGKKLVRLQTVSGHDSIFTCTGDHTPAQVIVIQPHNPGQTVQFSPEQLRVSYKINVCSPCPADVPGPRQSGL